MSTMRGSAVGVGTTVALAVLCAAPAARAQPRRPAPSPALRRAAALDRDGATAQARVIYRALLDSAADPAARAAVERAWAMSYAFDGDCPHTVAHEEQAIAYWRSRERTDPSNAFYQEGEIADEAARVCLDAGDLAAAEHWYREGYALGTREPAPRRHPASLWAFRLAHALGRIAARRDDTAEAARQVAAARRALDGDSAMAAGQERFFPYLTGYVALYTGQLDAAVRDLTAAVALPGNRRDPFMRCLLGMAYERLGREADARATYRAAYDLATAHNPPAAFVRPFVRRKLALPAAR